MTGEKVVQQLSTSDLDQWRRAWIPLRAVEINPAAFSAAETINIVAEWNRERSRILKRYLPDKPEAWIRASIYADTGIITIPE